MLPQLLYFLQIITLLGTVGWGIYKAYTAIQNWHERKEREQRKLKRAQWAQETKRLLYRELEKGDRYNKRKEDEDPNV